MLIVEDGTGVTGANGYITLAYADKFFFDRGLDSSGFAYDLSVGKAHDFWIGSDERKINSIIRATDHVESSYADHFLGEKAHLDQPLSFPRTVFNGIPECLKKSIALYALREINFVPPPDPTDLPDQAPEELITGTILKKREKVGPLEVETEYQKTHSNTQSRILFFHDFLNSKPLPQADNLLKPLLKPEATASPHKGGGCGTGTPAVDRGHFGVYKTIR